MKETRILECLERLENNLRFGSGLQMALDQANRELEAERAKKTPFGQRLVEDLNLSHLANHIRAKGLRLVNLETTLRDRRITIGATADINIDFLRAISGGAPLGRSLSGADIKFEMRF